MPRIIVGIDGSPASAKVLAVALEEAAAHHLPLTVVAVHLSPASVPSWGMPSMIPKREDVEATRRGAHEFVEAAMASQPDLEVEITVQVAAGVPGDVLLDEAARDDRIVIGSRGVGGLRRAFLGSVSNDVVHSAICPVTIVPTHL